MGRQNQTVSESIVVHGSSTGAVLERVHVAFRSIAGFVVTAPAPDVVQLAQNGRRFSRRPALCTIRAVQEPQRLVVTVTGELESHAVDTVREAILGRSTDEVASGAIESFREAEPQSPSNGFVPPTDWFVMPHDRVRVADHSPAALTGTAMPPPAVTSHEADGAFHTVLRGGPRPVMEPVVPERSAYVQVGTAPRQALDTTLLIGRAPQPRPTDPDGVQLLNVADAAMSKTHLAVSRIGDAIWVEDRNSSNGTKLDNGHGNTIDLLPGVRQAVSSESRFVAGDTVISIGWEL